MQRGTRLIYWTLILIFIAGTTGSTFLYFMERGQHNLDIVRFNDQLNSLSTDLTQTKDQLTDAQTTVKAKDDELTAKNAELAKVSADLTTKMKELSDAQAKIKDQQSQLSTNAAELTKLRSHPPLFTFAVDNPVTNIDQKKQDLESIMNLAYDQIVAVYSQPYLLDTVTIDFVKTLTNPNAYAETDIENGAKGLSLTIKIRDFDKNNFNDVNSIIHETIHAFHGLSVLDPAAYEEGITVAAADEVMRKLIAQGKIPAFSQLYVRITSSDYLNSKLTIPSDADAFYTSDNVADYYQLEGYGWQELEKADPHFFITFNEKLYAKKHQGVEITGDVVRQTIKESLTTSIDGKTVDQWLQTKAFALG